MKAARRVPVFDRCKPIRDLIAQNDAEIKDLQKVFQSGTPAEKGDAGRLIGELRAANIALFTALQHCEAMHDGAPIVD